MAAFEPRCNPEFPENPLDRIPLFGPLSGPDLTSYGLTKKTVDVTGADIFAQMQNPGTPAPFIVGQHSVLSSGERMAWKGDPSAYSVQGTSLVLRTRASSVVANALTEADVESAASYGPIFYAETAFTGPQINGEHAGFWFLSKDNGASDTTGGHTEVDLVEQYGPEDQYDHSSSHVWPGRRADFVHDYTSVKTARPEGKAISRHVYGLLAAEKSFVIYRDGSPIQRIDRLPFQRVPLYALFSLFGGNKPTAGATAVIDYFRVFEPGT